MGQFTGGINGYLINDVSLNILNQVQPITMLSSNSLPGSTAFISGADFISVEIDGVSNVSILKQFAPGTFTFTETSAAPEPSGGLLALSGLVVLGMIFLFQKSIQ